ncbi:zinc transport system substrate-binding protein [Meinhardsimonia xiamenensis]|jgi:zinc transport system substrate-binding protein|uniref:High-affinity zinc uptake system protein ZnuA n=1 Tax=Meinhardsimonia xiamenensis TaxID=990712 RepID=A0A1G8YWE0_9RHOB|nr:zinc ABC transporter substrate-binding protein [Meinhardsimonia xiamenensis]PRX37451.1 zinc transport system substrate-binding protein [Meinhardsimonia xiamenensis]SDK06744.1 zinc transport system substrate-binding protein [Meinhardsimonia xiamenensis]
MFFRNFLACLSAVATAIAAAPALRAEAPRVVADIAPVAALVAEVAGDRFEPALLVRGAADPHHMQLKPGEARAIASADLVVWVGPELTPWLADALDNLAPRARRLTLLDVPGTITRAPLFADPRASEEAPAGLHGHESGHDHEHGGDQAHTHAEDAHHSHDHAHGTRDPHAWLDPANAAVWVEAIAEALAEIDPGAAMHYRENARAGQARIAQAEAAVRERLAALGEIGLIVQHDAWAHFADRFGLHIRASLADSDATAAGAHRMAWLRETLATGELLCLVAEAPAPSPAMRRLAADTGLPMVVVDFLGLELRAAQGEYARLILGLAESLAQCARR